MKSAWVVLSATMIMIALSGCALPLPERGANSQFPVEIVLSSPTSIETAKVVQEGHAIVVSGTVRQLHEFHLPGKVLIVACGPDAAPLAEEESRITGYASKRGGVKEARFSVRIAMVPPPGTSFRVRYAAPGPPEESLSCQ